MRKRVYCDLYAKRTGKLAVNGRRHRGQTGEKNGNMFAQTPTNGIKLGSSRKRFKLDACNVVYENVAATMLVDGKKRKSAKG